jgi:MoaA/NifB/PqqE/SkfB family radical SAM enzyme
MRGSQDSWFSFKASINALRRATRLYVLNHSPRAFLQAFSALVLKATGHFPPINAYLAVTHRCQCRCPHCYSSVQDLSIHRELSTMEILSVLDQLKAMGTLQVAFTGGEPLLRQDIFELIAHAHGIGLLTRINTNGYSLDRACASNLKSSGLDQCGISIDYIDAESHDRFRALPGLHARALQAFGYLREFHIPQRMYVSASHAKIAAGLEHFVKFCKDLKVNSCFFTIPYAIGRWDRSYQEVLSENEMAGLRRLLKYSAAILEFPNPQTNCYAYDKTLISINPVGDVNPCPAVPFALGNVRNEPLAAIWRRHVSALNLESRGKCPLNTPQDRNKMEAHCASVLSGK